jgi:hypothetical protein
MSPKCGRECEIFQDYFLNDAMLRLNRAKQQQQYQYGGRLPSFVHYYPDQVGGGVASIFGNLFRFLLPAAGHVAKKTGRALAKHAFTTATNILGDISQGENWKTSGKRRLGETGDAILSQTQSKVSKMMSGNGLTGAGVNKKTDAEKILFSINGPPLVSGHKKKSKKKQVRRKKKPLKRLQNSIKNKSKKSKKKKKKKVGNKKQNKRRYQSKKRKVSKKKKKIVSKKNKTKKRIQTGQGYDFWL